MIKVLHVIYSLELGGGPIHIRKLVSDVPAQHFVAGGEGNLVGDFESLLGKEHILKLTGSFRARMEQISAFDRKTQPDIIHVHGRGAAILVRLSNIPKKSFRIIYTIHGFHAGNGHFLNKMLYKWIERFLYARTVKFIHVSSVELEEFSKFLGKTDPSKHLYIPNYIDIPPSSGKAPLQGINIMYVGRLSPEKGIDILLNALTMLPRYENVKFDIIGDGTYKNNYELFLKEKKVANNVSFLGPLRNASALMPQYQAVIIPSRKEGLPYVLLEAMAAKVPVISTPEKAIASVLPKNQPFMSKSFSPEDLANRIQAFIEGYPASEELRLRLVQENYAVLLQSFSRENTVKQIIELYKNVRANQINE